MNGPRGRPAGGAVGKSVVLTLLAVAVGVFILGRAFDDGEPDDPEAAGSDAPADAAEEDGTGGDDPDDAEGASAAGPDASDADETDPLQEAQQIVPLYTRRPEDVKVVAVNGTSKKGLAGATANILNARGYVTDTKNAASPPVLLSSIFYQAGYSDDAKAVAAAISAPADIIASAPDHVLTLIARPDDVGDFHIFVVLGVDDKVPVSAG